MNSQLAHSIKHRNYANDEFMTPIGLANYLAKLIPFGNSDVILEPCAGKGAFLNAIPQSFTIDRDFLDYNENVDWIVTNPPYSELDKWLEHCFGLARKGVALLLNTHSITPRRLEMANKAGFGLTVIHICKVFHWFGISAFCVWQRDEADAISYDRTVWR